MEDRICATCHGRVAVEDVACRHCGTSFDRTIRRHGSFLNDLFRLALGVWAISLPGLCLVVGLTSSWGDVDAYLTSRLYFVPWLVGIISLAILTWLTEERG